MIIALHWHRSLEKCLISEVASHELTEPVSVIEDSDKTVEGQITMEKHLRHHLMVIPSPGSHRSNVFAGKAKSSFCIQKDKRKIIYNNAMDEPNL